MAKYVLWQCSDITTQFFEEGEILLEVVGHPKLISFSPMLGIEYHLKSLDSQGDTYGCFDTDSMNDADACTFTNVAEVDDPEEVAKVIELFKLLD